MSDEATRQPNLKPNPRFDSTHEPAAGGSLDRSELADMGSGVEGHARHGEREPVGTARQFDSARPEPKSEESGAGIKPGLPLPANDDDERLLTLDDDPQPGDLCECGSCGHPFRFEHDNYYARYVSIICDTCIQHGWPWRNDE